MVDEDVDGTAVVDGTLEADTTTVVDGEDVDGGTVVDGILEVDTTTVVDGEDVDGGTVVDGILEVDTATVVDGEDVDAGTVGWDASVVGGLLELVDEGGHVAVVCVTDAVVAPDGGAAVWVTSGAGVGRHQTISASAMPARVTAIRAFSDGRAIFLPLGTG